MLRLTVLCLFFRVVVHSAEGGGFVFMVVAHKHVARVFTDLEFMEIWR